MIKVQVVTYGIPQGVLEADAYLRDKKAKLIKVSRVPAVGEYLIWRNENFQITKVIHSPETSAYTAIVEAKWCENM